MSEKKRVLITGFGPFGPLFFKKIPNISKTIAKELCNKIKEENIFELDDDAPLILSVNGKTYTEDLLIDRLDENNYDYIISMGRTLFTNNRKSSCILERKHKDKNNFFKENENKFQIKHDPKCVFWSPCKEVRNILYTRTIKDNFKWEFIHIAEINSAIRKNNKEIVNDIYDELMNNMK